MAGTVDLLLRCYTGLETREGMLGLHPALPAELGQVRFQISYRNHGILVDLAPTTMVLHLQARAVPPIRVCVDDKTTTMHAGHAYRFTLAAQAAPRASARVSLISREAAPQSVQ